MGKAATLKETIAKERRTNRRLRTLIAELQEQILTNRRDLDVQFARLAQLQAEVDIMKAERRRDRE
jgi:outer membrane protein TolC